MIRFTRDNRHNNPNNNTSNGIMKSHSKSEAADKQTDSLRRGGRSPVSNSRVLRSHGERGSGKGVGRVGRVGGGGGRSAGGKREAARCNRLK